MLTPLCRDIRLTDGTRWPGRRVPCSTSDCSELASSAYSGCGRTVRTGFVKIGEVRVVIMAALERRRIAESRAFEQQQHGLIDTSTVPEDGYCINYSLQLLAGVVSDTHSIIEPT